MLRFSEVIVSNNTSSSHISSNMIQKAQYDCVTVTLNKNKMLS